MVIVTVLHVLVCFALIMIVLLQAGNGLISIGSRVDVRDAEYFKHIPHHRAHPREVVDDQKVFAGKQGSVI